jgi:YbbR domain-containing protein
MAYHPFRNLWLKAFSIALATLLWFTVSRDQIVERSLRVPLEFQNVPEGLDIVGDPPATVDIRVRGASSLLGRLEPGEVIAVLDLRGARSGQRLFHLITDQVRAPFGIEVGQVSPPTVALTLERSGHRVVSVVPEVEGEPALGYVVGKVSAEPPTVEVVGPESHLEALTEATTEPVSIDGARGVVRDTVTIGVTDAALRLRDPRTAIVTVQVMPAPIERTIRSVAVRVRDDEKPNRTDLSPSVVDVVVRGPRDVVADLDGRGVEVYVEVAQLAPGRYTLPVKSDPRDVFEVLRTEPASVQVRVR